MFVQLRCEDRGRAGQARDTSRGRGRGSPRRRRRCRVVNIHPAKYISALTGVARCVCLNRAIQSSNTAAALAARVNTKPPREAERMRISNRISVNKSEAYMTKACLKNVFWYRFLVVYGNCCTCCWFIHFLQHSIVFTATRVKLPTNLRRFCALARAGYRGSRARARRQRGTLQLRRSKTVGLQKMQAQRDRDSQCEQQNKK